MGDNPVGKSAEGQALDPDPAMAAKGGEKETFAAKEHAFEIAGPLNIVIDRWFKGDQTAGINAQGLAVQLPLDDGPAGMHENHAIALQSLQNKAFTAKETDPETLLEGNAYPRAESGAEKSVLLAQDVAAIVAQIHSNNLAGIRSGKGGVLFTRPLVGKMGEKDRLATQGASYRH